MILIISLQERGRVSNGVPRQRRKSTVKKKCADDHTAHKKKLTASVTLVLRHSTGAPADPAAAFAPHQMQPALHPALSWIARC